MPPAVSSPPFDVPYDLSQENASGLPFFLQPEDEVVPQFLHPASDTEDSSEPETETMREIEAPTHPIPSMQGAFAESMLDSGSSNLAIAKDKIPSAAVRRQILIDQDLLEKTHASRWNQKSDQEHHELWKLMAQISFGIYLLLNGLAKDEDQVMTILQGHVNEVDAFLEMTMDDFDLAQADIEERLELLKMPLENIAIFNAMLEDRAFRLQIVTGNERIEHVIQRTTTAMKDALKDVQEGLSACKEFRVYLAEEHEKGAWRLEQPEMEKVYKAMKGNVDGWYKAYVSLKSKGNQLGRSLVQLGSIVAEMDRRAGEVSRKTRFSSNVSLSVTSPSESPRSSKQMRQSVLKSLPSGPNAIAPIIQEALPAFQLEEDREENPDDLSLLTPSSAAIEEEEAEPQFILAPTTYTPVSSPRPPQDLSEAARQPASSPPGLRQRSSLRARFSLKRKEKEVPVEAHSPLQPPPPIPDPNPYWGPRQRVSSSRSERVPSQTISQGGPSLTIETDPLPRGLDSAYYSDLEKPLSQNPPNHSQTSLSTNKSQPTITLPIQSNSHSKAQVSTSARSSPNLSGRIASSSPDSLPSTHDIASPATLPTQFFRPVNASPNSPLQRPWTAAPATNHMHNHSGGSGSSVKNGTYGRNHTPSVLGNRRAAPSATGMSVSGMSVGGMSTATGLTTVTEGGTKTKKKGAFGWLKKAFALSEEEKMAFEERKRNGGGGYGNGYRDGMNAAAAYNEHDDRPKWLDGKRIR